MEVSGNIWVCCMRIRLVLIDQMECTRSGVGSVWYLCCWYATIQQ